MVNERLNTTLAEYIPMIVVRQPYSASFSHVFGAKKFHIIPLLSSFRLLSVRKRSERTLTRQFPLTIGTQAGGAYPYSAVSTYYRYASSQIVPLLGSFH